TAGPASLNVLQIARPSLVADLRTTIHRAVKTGKPARKERALVRLEGRPCEVNIQVVPFKVATSEQSWLRVIFDETTHSLKSAIAPGALGKTAEQREMNELQRQLAASRESLQAII